MIIWRMLNITFSTGMASINGSVGLPFTCCGFSTFSTGMASINGSVGLPFTCCGFSGRFGLFTLFHIQWIPMIVRNSLALQCVALLEWKFNRYLFHSPCIMHHWLALLLLYSKISFLALLQSTLPILFITDIARTLVSKINYNMH